MTAIDNMSIARNLLTKVALAETLTEKENFHLQAMYGKVEDKDAPTLLAEAEAMELELKAMGQYRLKVLMTACEMWRYCQRNNREYRKEIQDDLNLAYDKLERLVEDIKTVNSDKLFTVTGSFSFIMAQIESLKMKLEKMDEANEKFI